MPAHVSSRSSSAVRRGFLGFALLAFTACSTGEVPAPEQQPAPASRPEHYGTLLAHVYFQDREDLQRLVSELDVLEHVDHEERFAAALLSWEEYSELLSRGYRVEIDEEQSSLLNRQRQMLGVEASGISWVPGRHVLYVESQDAAGNWGAPTAVFMTIQQGGPQTQVVQFASDVWKPNPQRTVI